MNRLNNFLQVLTELNIPQEQTEYFLEQNPEVIDGDYDTFIININTLFKHHIPKDEIGNLLLINANFLFYDNIDLKNKIKELKTQGDLLEIIQQNPNVF